MGVVVLSLVERWTFRVAVIEMGPVRYVTVKRSVVWDGTGSTVRTPLIREMWEVSTREMLASAGERPTTTGRFFPVV
jgi:hypothetical protein